MEFRVALVIPLFRNKKFANNLVEYLGYGYLASYLRYNGITVDIIDAYVENLSCESVCKKLEFGSYNLIGFTLMSSNYFENMKCILNNIPLSILEQAHITVGGYYATYHRGKLLIEDKRINSLIIGEGEQTLLELINKLKFNSTLELVDGLIFRAGIETFHNKPRALMNEAELDILPFPARDTIKAVLEGNGDIQILTSRGCYGNCTFCGVNVFYSSLEGKKWRGRSPENVVNEVEDLVQNYQINYLYFADEEFIGPGEKGKRRAQEIARLLIERKLEIKFCIYCRVDSVDKITFSILKQAGLDRVFLGVEFGVQKLLDYYEKGIKVEDSAKVIKTLEKLGINVSVGYIMFDPLMDIDIFRENFKFYKDNIRFNLKHLIRKLAVYNGSKAFKRLMGEISMDRTTTFDWLVGDHYIYNFKDKQVELLYKLLVNCLPVISPSKFYKKIITDVPKEMEDVYKKVWAEQIYNLIDNVALEIKAESDFSESKYLEYESKLKRMLIEQDLKFSEFEVSNPRAASSN